MELESTKNIKKEYALDSSKVHGFNIIPKSMKLDILKLDKYYITATLDDPKNITNIIYESNTEDKALEVFQLIDKEMKSLNYKITKGNFNSYFELKLFPEIYDKLKESREIIYLEVYHNAKEEKRKRYEKIKKAISSSKGIPFELTELINITID